ncbi:MAG: hypothetical protein HY749_03085 [Gammaproteobacteria bacterium]|nr:hypothetical protein [Gammaproteobacteria bacterium]
MQGGINPYLYVNANPLRFTDPTGQVAGIDDAAALTGLAALSSGVVCKAANCGKAVLDALKAAMNHLEPRRVDKTQRIILDIDIRIDAAVKMQQRTRAQRPIIEVSVRNAANKVPGISANAPL